MVITAMSCCYYVVAHTTLLKLGLDAICTSESSSKLVAMLYNA